MSIGGKKSKIADFDGITIRVLTRDEHCGPHVHALHEGDGWELKIFFSYADDKIIEVELAIGALPKQKVIQKCMDAVIDKLDECRKQYWEGVGKECCLVNQHVTIDQGGYVWDATAKTPGAMLVNTAKYLVSSKSLQFTVAGQTKTYKGVCP